MPSQTVDYDSLSFEARQAVARMQSADAALRRAEVAVTKAGDTGVSRDAAVRQYGTAKAVQRQAQEAMRVLAVQGHLPRGSEDIVFDRSN